MKKQSRTISATARVKTPSVTLTPKRLAVVLLQENTNTLALVKRAGDLDHKWDFLTFSLSQVWYPSSIELAQEGIMEACRRLPLTMPCSLLGFDINLESGVSWMIVSINNDCFQLQTHEYQDVQLFDYQTVCQENITKEVRDFFAYYHQHDNVFDNFKAQTWIH